jgi:signal transduction histidine kinase/GAF domain-containing protein
MINYRYVKVGPALFQNVAELVERGDSVVLLAPRFGGKRYSTKRISRILGERGSGLVASIRADDEIDSPERFAAALTSSLESDGGQPACGGDPLFGRLDAFWERHQRRAVLLASHVDGLRHDIAQQFLEGVRVRVEARQLVVVLGGDQSLRYLVHGPNSEFNCADQFVLQGFEWSEFHAWLEQYCRVLNMRVTPEVGREFFEQAGGSLYVLRALLWQALDARGKHGDGGAICLTAEDARKRIRLEWATTAADAAVFRHGIECVARDPSCWADLEHLIEGTECLPVRGYGPGSLEMSGFAVRQGGSICLASPAIEDFVRSYYDPRRLADLYATNGEWKEAFGRYEKLPEPQWTRPLSSGDRDELKSVLHSLSAEIAEAAKTGTELVAKLTAQGMTLLLGLSEMTFWRFGEGWELEREVWGRLAETDRYDLARAFPSSPQNVSRLLDLPDTSSRLAVAATVRVFDDTKPRVVVLSGMASQKALSRERQKAAEELLKIFLAAYEHASEIQSLREQKSIRQRHVEILNAILDAIGIEILDVQYVIKAAARELRKLGYRRVHCCMVDPERKWIRGVWDDSDQKPLIDLAAMTAYVLSDPTRDIQPYVATQGKHMIIPDASKEPLVNQPIVKLTGMKALALVPILDQDDSVLGTIHVEREDKRVPTEQEVTDLELFGRLLATVISLSEQVTLLEKALDEIFDPIAIIDPTYRCRYANAEASRMLQVPTGWRSWGGAGQLEGEDANRLRPLLEDAFSTKKKHADQLSDLTGGAPGNRYHAFTSTIEDGNRRVVGAVTHLQDLTSLHRVADMLNLVIRAGRSGKALEAVLEAMGKLGHEWARIYLLRGNGEQKQLVSSLSVGPVQSELAAFNRGEVVLSSHVPGHHSWLCLERGDALIFRWDPGGVEGAETRTSKGLPVVITREPEFPQLFHKKPGDYWIDMPLLAGREWLGKLSTDCQEHMEPRRYWMLKILGALVSQIILTFREREAEQKRQEEWIEQGHQRSIGTIAHNLNSKLWPLPIYLERYRGLDIDNNELHEVNAKFAQVVESVQACIRRAKDLLAVPALQVDRFDLRNLIQRILDAQFKMPVEPKMNCAEPEFPVRADSELIEAALLEIIDNTRKALRSVTKPTITVRLERLEQPAPAVTIRVADNGPGVPDEFRERVFKEFFSRWPGQKIGTGLGLAFVQRVVEAHGGTIRVEDCSGGGAEFIIELPQDREAQ